MFKKRLIALSSSLIVGSMCIVGCSKTDVKKPNKNQNTISLENGVEAPAKKPNSEELEKLEQEKQEEIEKLEESEANKEIVKIWIPNVEYISSGDDSLDKLLQVEVESVSKEEESDKYLRMLKTLNKQGDSPIQAIEFKSATLNGSTLIVDMADATELGIGSTTTEFMILEQVLLTMFDNFEEVSKIQFKVDGKVVDSFLGHMDISQPFDRK